MTAINGQWFLAIVLAFDSDRDALKTVPAAPVDGTYVGDIKFGEALPAGNNNIGNVDVADLLGITSAGQATKANSLPVTFASDQDDLGVDVASMPGAVQGPGNPTVNSYDSAVVSLSADTADQELIAAPGANKQIWVYGCVFLADTGAGTITLQDEDDVAISGTMAISDEGGFVKNASGNFAMPWFVVPTNKALEADTVTCSVGGTIEYAIVDVS